VAERVMGWIGSVFKGPSIRINNRITLEGDPIWTTPDGDLYHRARSMDGSFVGDECPHFSSDIKAAWLVVEKIPMALIPLQDGRWCAHVGIHEWIGDYIGWYEIDIESEYSVIASTTSEAICLAALKAVDI